MERPIGGGMNAYHHIDVVTRDDGGADVRHETNDDNDDGWPDGKVTRWTDRWRDAEAARRSAGVSRTGVSGVRVRVTVDGVEV